MIRFSLNADIGCNSDGETNPADTSVAEADGKTLVSCVRPEWTYYFASDILNVDIKFGAAKEDLILWRANFEEFTRHLRDKVRFTIISYLNCMPLLPTQI